ncbi:MAG: hypothetical protein SNI51_04065 [Rikenellaceae bacterium]
MKRLRYIIPLLLLSFASCREFHVHFFGDHVMAEVDGKTLMHSDVVPIIPKEYRGEDSVIFAKTYIDKWVRKQVKLREAERIFLSSEADIEAMVEEYRQLLLIKKLDEHCVNSSIDTTYTDHEISQYYQQNSNNFHLGRNIIKGEVLRIPLGDNQARKIKELFGSTDQAKREDMISICEKNGFDFVDLTQSWVEASEILDLLPLVRGEQSDKILSQRGAQHMKDDNYEYYYQIVDSRKVGDVSPLEWVRSTIRTILATERQQNLIRDNEESLYNSAMSEEMIRFQYQEREAKEAERIQAKSLEVEE